MAFSITGMTHGSSLPRIDKQFRPKRIDTSASVLDQYYTRDDIAKHCYGVFRARFDPGDFLMVEPSAGTGAFSKLLPYGSLAYDLVPKHPGIEEADFLSVKLPRDRNIAVIGNPPFGKNASMAVRFFNHAAAQSNVIAMIFPRTFRKASIQNRLDPDFHLIYEEILPVDAFVFNAAPYDVPAVFQIWERRDVRRVQRSVETTHPDFTFTTADRAHFAIQRVGANAGRLHRDFAKSPSSHYFVHVPAKATHNFVEATMAQLDFANVASNAAGNPSLAKSEIVSLYRDHTEGRVIVPASACLCCWHFVP